uniref:Toll-like receptor 22 n=1 Tax=Haplochromis burtoni TaxID=8153 RepID=A0A3Q2V4I5_HAPBU
MDPRINQGIKSTLEGCGKEVFCLPSVRWDDGGRYLTAIPDDIPKNAVLLNLKSNYISNITRMNLEGLFKLEVLNLEKNWISQIDGEAFADLVELKVLILSINRLATLTENMFQGLSKLETLSLDWNQISFISPVALKKFSITRDIFPHLQSLDLRGWNGDIEWEVSNKTFLKSLTRLQMSETSLSFDVYRAILQTAYSLQELQMDNIQKWIDDDFIDVACKIPSLRTLNVSSSEIYTLKENMLQSCSHLTNLNLSFNNIKSMADNALQSMTQLRSLILQNNELSELPVAVQGLTTLEVYDLSINDISELYCPYFWNLTSLTILDLSHNHISYIFDCTLEFLYLKNNELINLFQGVFSNLSSLRYLNLDVRMCNNVEEGGLKGLYNLQFLFMQGDIYFYEHFSGLSKQSDNPFSNLPKLKNGLTSLDELSVLTSDVFLPIPNLIILDLSNNKLRSLDFLAEAKLSALRWLDVSNNELFVISETVIQSLLTMKYLDLSANLLTCECSNYGLIQWIQGSKQTQVVNAHQYTCSFPVSQRGNKFLDFGFDSCWIDAALLCFLFSSSLVMLTLLASFIYHFLRSHLTYTYYLFLAFLYDNKRRKKGIPHSYDAFVSYNVHDEAWVYGELLPELEGQQGWRLCLHHRDFEPGKPIVENITEAIYCSRKTICVISQHYLQSEWCSKEIQMASYRLFNEHKDVMIMVFLEDIPAKQLSPYFQIRSLVKKRSYLSWPQAVHHTGVFWQKIQQALKREENPADHRCLLTGYQRVIQ